MQRKREIRNELIPLQKLLDELREKVASTRAAHYDVTDVSSPSGR